MASPHEGWAVIREELDPELWEHVCANTGRSSEGPSRGTTGRRYGAPLHPRSLRGRAMTDTERMPNTEAADYIEDDPQAWAAWLDALGRFIPFHDSLTDHFRTHATADSIIGGSILAYLADTYGLYLLRATPDDARPYGLQEALRDRGLPAHTTLNGLLVHERAQQAATDGAWKEAHDAVVSSIGEDRCDFDCDACDVEIRLRHGSDR